MTHLEILLYPSMSAQPSSESLLREVDRNQYRGPETEYAEGRILEKSVLEWLYQTSPLRALGVMGKRSQNVNLERMDAAKETFW